jgi:tetratricopeptide (TPR) repeat protein
MHRLLPVLLVFAPFASAQEPPNAADLWARCGTQIEWLTDGVKLPDGESIGRRAPKPTTDRAELLEQAKKKSAEVKRLILWYVPRTSGGHMNRATLLDGYLKAVAWSDPDVVELVRRKFVPLRMSADRAVGAPLGIKPFDFVEPGFVFLNEKGEAVHVIDRLRTFSSEWVLETLLKVLAKHPDYNETKATRAEELLLGGDHAAALKAAGETAKGRMLAARAHRRMRQVAECEKALAEAEKGGDEALKNEAAVERGRLLLNQAKLDEALKAFDGALKHKGPRTAEARYWIAWIHWHSARDEEARKTWALMVKDFPDSPWTWRASGNLAKASDTLLDGPIVHEFEETAWAPESAELPTRTMHSRGEKEFDDVVKRAVAWLIRHQRSDGAWTDSRYVMCPDPKILPNVFTAVAAIGATALLEWRDVDPKGCDAAREKAEKYLLDESHLNRKNNEECYADGYRLLYLSRKAKRVKEGRDAALKRMEEIATKLAASQGKNGFWAHEYPNPFCTAAVLWCLQQAQAADAKVDATMLQKAAEALKKSRGPEGRQPYSGGRASPAKDSSARNAICDVALLGAKLATEEELAGTVAMYWAWMKNSEAVRVCDFHSDGELGGFFFWHGFYHTVEAAAALGKEKGAEGLAKAREHLLKIPEWDGSFIDSHELGKGYGTAMALLSLRVVSPGK